MKITVPEDNRPLPQSIALRLPMPRFKRQLAALKLDDENIVAPLFDSQKASLFVFGRTSKLVPLFPTWSGFMARTPALKGPDPFMARARAQAGSDALAGLKQF